MIEFTDLVTLKPTEVKRYFDENPEAEELYWQLVYEKYGYAHGARDHSTPWLALKKNRRQD